MPAGKPVSKALTAVKKRPQGRPTKYNPEAVTKLKAAFANSFTVDQAVAYAGISKQTYYDWGERINGFLDEMDAVKEAPTMKAKQIVVGSINAGDVETSKWWLKNKASDEFGGRPQELNLGVHFHQHTGEKKEDYGF